MKRLLLAVAVALAAAAPAAASDAGYTGPTDGPVITADARVQWALDVARQVWRDEPAPACSSIVVRLYDDPTGETSGWALRPAEPGGVCTIGIERRTLAVPDWWDWDLLGTTVSHELGHLLGHDHGWVGHQGVMNVVGQTPVEVAAAVAPIRREWLARASAAAAAAWARSEHRDAVRRARKAWRR